METRTVEIVLQQLDKRLVAQLTVGYPPPPTVSYAGRQWYRASGIGADLAVYRPDRPFARPATQEEPMPKLAIGVPRRRR